LWLQVTVSQEESRVVDDCLGRLVVLVRPIMGRAWGGDRYRAKVGIANVKSVLGRIPLGRQTETVCQEGYGADCRESSLAVV